MKLHKSQAFLVLTFITVLSAFAFVEHAKAVAITGDTAASTSGLGNFSGSLTYSFTDATTAQLIIELTNTSPIDNGGFLTAFVFNNPGDLIESVGFSSTDLDFQLLGGPGFDDGVNGAPFGQFDVGSSTGDFEGGGAPSAGLGVGQSATFTFLFTGTLLDTLSDLSFLSAFSEGTGAGEGYQAFVARFRGFNDDGSDKVPAIPTPGTEVPEPATVGLLGISLLGARYFARKQRKA